ncbi:MAG: hypothetical protein RI935_459 [Candidatus Parcubacteria bacterium]|jgi:hypothetical protein
MSTLSAKEEWEHIGNRIHNRIRPFITKSSYNQFERINVVKEALEIFEKETGSQCTFKTNERGGLIIILKNTPLVNERSHKDV